MQENDKAVQTLDLSPTKYYQLINENTRYALYLSSGSEHFQKEKAYLSEPNQQSLGQVWQVIRIPDNIRFTNCYEIVHTRSTLVLTKTEKQAVRLRFGKWQNTQLFHIELVEDRIVRFVCNDNNQWLLYFDSHELKLGPFQRNNKKCHWQIKPCTDNPIIKRSCYLQNIFSNMVIDIPRASLSTGCVLIQYPLNNRFNQRFNILQKDNHFKIYSLSSKLFITAHKKCREGDKITQEDFIEGEGEKVKQQQWVIEYQGRNSFLIRSAINLSMFLGIKENQYKGEAPLITTSAYDFSLWKIVGFLPDRHEICNL